MASMFSSAMEVASNCPKRITSAIRKELMESFFGLSDIHFSERIGLDRIDHIDGISFGFEK